MSASTGSAPQGVPGEPRSFGQAALETASSAMQRFGPIRKIGLHFCAFHFYADNMGRQVEAHHYCSHLSNKVQQCLVYDSEAADARLIGVEFVISEDLYSGLPEEEKRMWHSHEYEVKSGILFLPELLPAAERPVMEELVKTYGKTWQFWQFDRGDALPLGVPQLMGAFYRDGQIEPRLIKEVEQRYSLSLEERSKQRSDLAGPVFSGDMLQKHFDAEKGYTLQMEECKLKHKPASERKGAEAA